MIAMTETLAALAMPPQQLPTVIQLLLGNLMRSALLVKLHNLDSTTTALIGGFP